MALVKKKDGWHAEDKFPFNGARMLCISTYKISGKLVSSANVNKYEEGSCTHAYGLAGGGDFGRYVISVPGGRGTEKAIAEQHALAVAMVPQLLEEARAHYAKYPPID